MVRRVLGSLTLAAALTFGLASTSLGATFGSPSGNETSADAPFTQIVKGVEYDWDLFADRDAIAGYTLVSASYSATVDITCHGGEQDGQPGFRFISFNGEAAVPFLVGSKLRAALAAAKVRGSEDTFDTCTNTDTFASKIVVVAFALVAASPVTSFSEQQCIDFGNGNELLSLTGASRTATGTALVNGRRFRVTAGTIVHQQWNSAPASCS